MSNNRTRQDAFERVVDAKMGSLASPNAISGEFKPDGKTPSDEYVAGLVEFVEDWLVSLKSNPAVIAACIRYHEKQFGEENY